MNTITLNISNAEVALLRSTLNTAAQQRYSELKSAEDSKAGPLAVKARAVAMHEAEELLRVVGNSIDAAKANS